MRADREQRVVRRLCAANAIHFPASQRRLLCSLEGGKGGEEMRILEVEEYLYTSVGDVERGAGFIGSKVRQSKRETKRGVTARAVMHRG